MLTGGRAPATLELARVLHRAGHQVEVAESLALHLCRFSKAVRRCHNLPAPNQQPQRFREAVTRLAADVDLLIPTCEETFWVAGLPRVWCPPLECLLPLHSKWRFQERVAAHGLEPISSHYCRQVEELRPFLDGNHVIKEEYSRFAQRVLINPRQLGRLGRGPWVVQPYLHGQELCALALARNGRVLARAVYPSELRVGHGSALRFRSLHHSGVNAWLDRFVAAENHTGFLAFDFIETPDGRLLALECNPRLTSGIHLLAGEPGLASVFWQDPPETLAPPHGEVAQLSQAMLLFGHVYEAFRARDVIFHRDDPWPGLLQAATLLPLAWRAWRQRISLLEATTWDIEWNG